MTEPDDIRGLDRGFGVSVQGTTIVYPAACLGMYVTAKGMFLSPRNTPIVVSWKSPQTIAAAGGGISYSLDTVQPQMMMPSGHKGAGTMYRGTFDCWQKSSKTKGAKPSSRTHGPTS